MAGAETASRPDDAFAQGSSPNTGPSDCRNVTFAVSGAYNGPMQRVVGLLTLAVCACLVAGCGGSAFQAKARKVVADPHATL